MENEMFIVVEDPEGQYFEGSLVERQLSVQLQSRGVDLLPVNPELFRQSGAGGFFKRAWGAGWPLDALYPRTNAPMVLYCDALHKVLTWKARLTATPEFLAQPEDQRIGQLQILADVGQISPFHVSLTETGPGVQIKLLGAPDHHGGWTVGGQGTVTCRTEGHAGFALYGYAPGLRVLWSAVTLTEESRR